MNWKEVAEKALTLGATVSYDTLFNDYQITFRNFRIYTSCGRIDYMYEYYDEVRDEFVSDSNVIAEGRTPDQIVQFLEAIKYED